MNGLERESMVLLNRFFSQHREPRSLLSSGLRPSEVLDRLSGPGQPDPGFSAAREIDRAQALGFSMIFLTDPVYPDSLKQISDPPLVLYVKGSLVPQDDASLAIVGSRNPTDYGIQQARFFAHALASSGLTVVSGLARGIDEAAHHGALNAKNGRTLAVLCSGLDVVYPAANAALFDRISEHGAVLSEYALGTQPLQHHFPRRNRIISGLSLGVFVVEAHTRSGSLITAREAAEQGREVFALPGPVDRLTSRGTNQLLKEGAYLADGPDDILAVLAGPLSRVLEKLKSASINDEASEVSAVPASVPAASIPAAAEEGPADPLERLVLAALASGPRHYEEIRDETGAPGGLLARTLTVLELKTLIRKSPDGSYGLAGRPSRVC